MTRRPSPRAAALVHEPAISRRDLVKGAAATSVAAAAFGQYSARRAAAAQDQVNLVVPTHWGDQQYLGPFQSLIDEYQEQNPNVTIEYQTVAFEELLNRITTGQLGGDTPDCFHFYNLWLPEFAGSNLLAAPPDEAVSDIQGAYAEGTVAGASFNDQVWGYPTEVNVWQLLYNRQLMEAAGITSPPETWDAFREAAAALTNPDEGVAGLVLLSNWDSGAVHPWTSLLWSNGGEYVSEDASEALFNSQEGIDTLQMQVDLLDEGSAVTGTLEDNDFVNGLAAMFFIPNFYGSTLRSGMQGGIENVGVAPIPHTEGNESTALQYEWLWGVSQASQQQEEAWRFLQWLNMPRSGGQMASPAAGAASSPMGDFLTTALNAIPGRTSDQEAHEDVVGDPFVAPFVDALATARTEPIVAGAQEIKTALHTQIEAAWFGEKEPDQALNDAADEANRILGERG